MFGLEEVGSALAARPVCAIALPSTDALLGMVSGAFVAALGAELFFLLGCEVLRTRKVEDDFLYFFLHFGVLCACAVSEELAGFLGVNVKLPAGVKLLAGARTLFVGLLRLLFSSHVVCSFHVGG